MHTVTLKQAAIATFLGLLFYGADIRAETGEKVNASASSAIVAEGGSQAQPAEKPPVHSATRIDTAPKIDGDLSDPVWSAVPIISEFIQQLPDEGAPATERTEVKIAYDRNNLYFAARCFDSEPDKIIAHEMRRDVRSISTKEDSFMVVLDTFHDHRNGASFIVTPKGSINDLLVTDERQFNWDWDTIWDARTRIDDQGWTVEIIIPFKSLRYDTNRSKSWGIILRRVVMRKNETSFTTRIPRELGVIGGGKVSSAADLVGLDDVTRARYLEFKPYGKSGFSQDFSVDRTAPVDGFADGGIDLKYGLSQGLNLDLTYNTDFSQVEADTQQINLTRFNLFFPEKREFFLEGRDIYNFGAPTSSTQRNTTLLFFSRRIGIEGGEEVPIIAGARLTGTAGRYKIGMLNIETDESTRSPRTNFTVIRLKRDILRRSNLGMIFTNKSPSGTGSNQTYGVDANFSFFRSSTASGFLTKSSTPGISTGDYSGRAQLNLDVDLWGVGIDHLTVGPNFNPEVGFVRRRDIRSTYGGIRFSPRPNKKLLRRYELSTDMEYLTDTANVLQTRYNRVSLAFESFREDKLTFSATKNLENLEEPFRIQPTIEIPVGVYDFNVYEVRFDLGPSRGTTGYLSYEFGGFFSGDRKTLTLNAISKPGSHFSFEANYERNDVDLPEGAFVTHLVGTRLNYALSTRFFTSGYIQWNSDAELAAVNLRLNYIYKLGSDLFVVYNENRYTDGPFIGVINRSFIVKFTYLLRI